MTQLSVYTRGSVPPFLSSSFPRISLMSAFPPRDSFLPTFPEGELGQVGDHLARNYPGLVPLPRRTLEGSSQTDDTISPGATVRARHEKSKRPRYSRHNQELAGDHDKSHSRKVRRRVVTSGSFPSPTTDRASQRLQSITLPRHTYSLNLLSNLFRASHMRTRDVVQGETSKSSPSPPYI